MKIRNGFVSNSSSASFIINLNLLTPSQIKRIIKYLTNKNVDGWDWNIQKNGKLKGFTIMDNGDFTDLLEKIKIDKNAIEEWDGDGH